MLVKCLKKSHKISYKAKGSLYKHSGCVTVKERSPEQGPEEFTPKRGTPWRTIGVLNICDRIIFQLPHTGTEIHLGKQGIHT